MVSIPQSGFGAFELSISLAAWRRCRKVSIPQSGFGAFEQGRAQNPLFDRFCFNPSVGIRGV